MSRLITKSNIKFSKDILVLLLIITTMALYIFLSFNYTKYLKRILPLKIEEEFIQIIKKNIKLCDYDLENIINVVYKGNKIQYIETNNNILNNITNSIQTLIDEKNTFSNFDKVGNNYYFSLPVTTNNNVLLNNIGTNIPVKIDFFKNIMCYIKTDVNNYGINNSLIKIYLEVYLDQTFYFPYANKGKRKKIRIELGTRIIPGNIPYFYNKS